MADYGTDTGTETPHRRRFPAPWRVVPVPGGYAVEDANGIRMAYVYADTSEMQSASVTDKLTMDEARRVAAGISRLPDLLSAKAK